jgi:hypothetical protein
MGFKSWLSNAWQKVKQGVNKAGSWIGNAGRKILPAIGKIGTIVAPIAGAINPALGKIIGGIGHGAEKIGGFIQKPSVDKAFDMAREAGGGKYVDKLKPVWDRGKQAYDNVRGTQVLNPKPHLM